LEILADFAGEKKSKGTAYHSWQSIRSIIQGSSEHVPASTFSR